MTQHLKYLTCIISTKQVELSDAARDKVDDAHFRALLDVYWTLPDWQQKCLLVDMIQDHLVGRRAELAHDASVEAVATDILRAPGDNSNWCDLAVFPKIWALRYLTGVDHFSSHLDQIRNAVRAELATRGPVALRRLVDRALHSDETSAGYAAFAVMLGFDASDPTTDELSVIGDAVAAPGVAIQRVEPLLFRLKAKARPLIPRLLGDERAEWRCAGVRLAADALTPDTWLNAVADPSPDVRHAAVLKLVAAHWLPVDSPRRPADYKARVRTALADPAYVVRLTAAGSVYPDMERNVIIARMIAETQAPSERTALRWALIGSDDWELTRFDPMFGGAEVRAALIATLGDPDAELRQHALEWIDLRVAVSGDDGAEMADFRSAAEQARLSLTTNADGTP